MRTTVVFPAPLGPSSPSTDPWGTVRSTPARAVVAPKRFARPSTTIASVMTGTLGPGGDSSRPLFAVGATDGGKRGVPCPSRPGVAPELIAGAGWSVVRDLVARPDQGGGDLLGVRGPAGLQDDEDLHLAHVQPGPGALVLDLQHVGTDGGELGQYRGERPRPVRDDESQGQVAPRGRHAVLDDLEQQHRVDVAAGEHGHDGGREGGRVGQHGGDRGHTRRLHDELGALEAEQQRAGEVLLADGPDLVDQAPDVGEGERARRGDGDPVGHGRHALQRDGRPCSSELGNAAAPSAWTATTRTSGRRALTAAATPETSPPPPVQTSTVATSGHWSSTSSPTVP